MTTAIQFGSYDAAQTFRSRHSEHIAQADDARFKTVVLADDVPSDVLSEAEQAAAGTDGEGVTDGDPPTANYDDLESDELGELRRAWGEYIAGARQAFRAYHRVNDLRSDISLSPLRFDELTGRPEDVTDALLDELQAADGLIPEDMTAEELVEASHHAATPGTVPKGPKHTDADPGESTLRAGLEKAVEADVSLSADEAYHGVGAVGSGASQLEKQLEAEGESERELIKGSLSDSIGGDSHLSDVDNNPSTTPPGDLDDVSDLDGLNGWDYYQPDASRAGAKFLLHDQVRPGRDLTGETRPEGEVEEHLGRIRIKKHGGNFSRSTESYSAVYREELFVYQGPDDNKPTMVGGDSLNIVERVEDREAALKAAWRFATLDPAERDSFILAQFRDSILVEWNGHKFPETIGDFEYREASSDDKIGWVAPAPQLADPDEPQKSTLLVFIEETRDGYDVRSRRVDGNFDVYPWDRHSGSAYQLDETDLSWGRALKKAVQHCRKLTDMDNIGQQVDSLPSFSIETELRVLKPLLNVAKRSQEFGDNSTAYTKLTVEEDWLRLKAPGNTGNVALMAGIDVDPADLDRYEVEREGVAYIDAGRFWRHFTDAGLTSTLSLTVEERPVYEPPRLGVEIDGNKVEVSDRSNPIDTVYSYLVPEETILSGRFADETELPEYEYAYGGETTVDTFTGALDRVETNQFWISAGAQRLAVGGEDAGPMNRADLYRVGDAEASLGRGSSLYGHDLFADVLRAIPRQSGKPMTLKFGTAPDTVGHAGNGPAEVKIPVGSSDVTLLIAPRVIKDEDDITPPLGHDATRPGDTLPSEVIA